MAYLVKNFFNQHLEKLGLTVIHSAPDSLKEIRIPEAHRPGLFLAGYKKYHAKKRVLVFGRVEIGYLKDLPKMKRKQVLAALLEPTVPAVIVARDLLLPSELKELCSERGIALFSSKLLTTTLLNKLSFFLNELFTKAHTIHGTLVELFGIGVLLQGSSSVGKSEAALGLMERGHRLIADDAVQIRKREGAYLEGDCPPLTKHYMEIRGIGLINVAHIYGLVSLGDKKVIDIVVLMEPWDDAHRYDRLGLDEETIDIDGIKLPFYLLPVKPGRDIALLIETIVLNYRLKKMGSAFHPAKVFQEQLRETIHQS